MKTHDVHDQLAGLSGQYPVYRPESPHNQALALDLPAALRNRRDQRYRGEDFDVSVSALSPTD